jgi:hypothetical protein
MNSVSIVSKRIMRIMSVSLAYHGKKKEFLNDFASLIQKRIMRIMFWRACLFNYTAIFKENKDKSARSTAIKEKSWHGNIAIIPKSTETLRQLLQFGR